jgi:IclR helix-turn-helix domain
MGFWDKNLSIVKCLHDHGKQSVRRLAQKTGLAKSSVHRLQQAMERRGGRPDSWWWETEAGRPWLTRLVVATLSTFGLKRGVGLEPMQAFFVRLHLATQVGCSPSALRRVMQTLEARILETAATWEKDEIATSEGCEMIGAVDETFLEQMVLVFMDLPSGYVVLEETADDRSYATWHALVDKRLPALRAQGRYLVSDRAKALIQLAEKGLACLSIPDFFHLVHDIVQSYWLALGRRRQQASQGLHKAEERLQKPRPVAPADEAYRAATHQVEAQQVEVTRWEALQHVYRQQLASLSLTLPPVSLDTAAPQTATQVAARLHAQVEAIEALAQSAQLPERPETMRKVKKQVPEVAALVAFWWQGVRRDLEQAAVSPLWQRWAQEVLLPRRYWE